MYRTKYNCVILQTALELATWEGRPLSICFIDLKKAYDSTQHAKLLSVLLQGLKIEPSNVKFLPKYISKSGNLFALIESLLDHFLWTRGLGRVALEVPSYFLLNIDHLEQHLHEGVLANLTAYKKIGYLSWRTAYCCNYVCKWYGVIGKVYTGYAGYPWYT